MPHRPFAFTSWRRALLALACCAAIVPAQAGEWWTAFNDATLNLLVADAPAAHESARAAALQAQATLASEYVQARLAGVRLVTAGILIGALQRQRTLLAGAANDPEAQQSIPLVDQLLARARTRAAEFEQLRQASLQALARQAGGRSPEALAALLQPALRDPRVPSPDFELPREVSGLVLRQRPDVAQAETELARAGRDSTIEQLRLAKYLQALAAPIVPDDAAPEAGSGSSPEQVLDHARQDIAHRLALLLAQLEGAQQQSLHAQRLLAEYELVRRRYARGELSELKALQALTVTLVEDDRVAAARGQVSLAWIAWQQSIGGAGNARTEELLGATRAADDE